MASSNNLREGPISVKSESYARNLVVHLSRLHTPVREIVLKKFPQITQKMPAVPEEELEEICWGISVNKAPGLNAVPNGAAKLPIKTISDWFISGE